MSNSNSPPSPTASLPFIETNYVICHTPNEASLRPLPQPPAPAPLPPTVIPPASAFALARRPIPQTQQNVPKYPTTTQHHQRTGTQQQRPVQQYTYSRPRILGRPAARTVGLGSPSAPSSPAPPPVTTVEETEVPTEACIPAASSNITDGNAMGNNGGLGTENMYMAAPQSQSTPSDQNVTEAAFEEEVVLCQDASGVDPAQIQLNYLPIAQNTEQIQFPITDLGGLYELIGLPMPSSTSVEGSSGMLGIPGSLESQVMAPNSALTYTLGIDESQNPTISMSQDNVIQGLEEYYLTSSVPETVSSQLPIGIEETAHLTSSQTEEVIEEIEAVTGQSIMSFEDFSDLIRSLPPMESGDGTANVSVSQGVEENQVFEASPNITNQPEVGIVSFEEMETQSVFVLEETPEGDATKSDLPPIGTEEARLEPEQPDPVQDAVSVEDPPNILTTDLRNNVKISESEPSAEPTVITISIDEDGDEDVPVIDISSDTEESPPVSQPVTVLSNSNSGTVCPVVPLPVEEPSESKEELPKCNVPGAEFEEKSEQVPLPDPEIVVLELDESKTPQQNGTDTSDKTVGLTNGIDECHVKLEADEELGSSTATEMSPTDSNLDSETEAVVKNSTSDDVKPEINGEVITNGVTGTDHSAHEDTNGIILPLPDPSVFSEASTKLVWENGIGTFPGTELKFRVNQTTGVLETCDSSLPLIRAFKQDENKFPKLPIETETPPLKSAKGKKLVAKKTDKEKPNPILPVARTLNVKSTTKKMMKNKKFPKPAAASKESETPKEEASVDEVKIEPEEEEAALSTTGYIEGYVEIAPEEKPKNIELPVEISPNKSSTEVGPEPASAPKPKSKLPKKTPKDKAPQIPAKTEESKPESPKLVYAKKSAPIPILPVLPELPVPVEKSLGVLTVVPILQNSSPLPSPDLEEGQDEGGKGSGESGRPRKTKGARVPVAPKGKKYKKRRKKVTVEQKLRMKQVANKKRNFEKVLNTRTQHFINVAHPGDSATNETMTESSYASSGNEEPMAAASKQSSSSESGGKSKSKTSPIVMAEFSWPKYLADMNAKGAPSRLFHQPAFPPENPFKVNMMLEAIDPQHQSLCCVASIVEIQGYRLRVHITGYSESYDFWVNADSYEIFPAGWCEENGHTLEPPPNVETPFNWHKYLIDEQMVAADRNFFAISKEDPVMNSDVAIGMKLEAVDIRNQSLICVATIAQVINDRFLVHFDSWDAVYDYWTDATSPFIHPVGWCEKNGAHLTPPNTYKTEFSWETYLQETKAVPMPSHLFRPLLPLHFKKGMKLECVDKRNPFLIRVATIMEAEGHQLTINFDNWPTVFDYKVYECSPDIHPVGWCEHTGHPLQPPPPISSTTRSWNGPCLVYGCLGLGHVKGPKFLTHNTPSNCPYSATNLKKELLDHVSDRVITYEKPINPPPPEVVKRDWTTLSPLKTREKRKIEQGQKTGKILHKRKSYVQEGAPAKIKKKSTERKSDPIIPTLSMYDTPTTSSEEAKQLLTIKTEPMQDSFNSVDSIPLIRKTKLTCKQLNFSATSSDTVSKLSPAERDKITIESVPMTLEQSGTGAVASAQMDTNKEPVSLLRKNLTIKRKSESAISPKPKRAYTPRGTKAKATSLLVGPVIPEKVPGPGPSGIVLPKIESTITACPPPGTGPGPAKPFHTWDETIDSVVRSCLRKNVSEEGQGGQPEFVLPPSTTMTPIPVPTTFPLSIQTQDKSPKTDNSLLLMMIPSNAATASTSTASNSVVVTPIPSEVTAFEQPTRPRSRGASIGEEMRPRKSTSQMSPFESFSSNQGDSEYGAIPNYDIHIRPLRTLVGDLSHTTVSTWMTKDVAEFVARIPGCTAAAKRFTEEKIDGDAFLLMTQSDYSSIMGLKIGPCMKLAHAVHLIHVNSN